MRSSFLARTGVLAAAAALSLCAANAAHAELIYGITATSLVTFDSASPASLTTVGSFSGLVAGQTLQAIDFRASNGTLYALSSSGTAAQLYTVNLTTGALTTVGSGLTLTGNTSTVVSIDFNPVVDALRVVGGNQSYRVNANTGALIAQDTAFSPANTYGDVAYSNNVAGATSTTLYAYNYTADTIGFIGGIGGTPSPNGGVYTSLGSSGVSSLGPTALGFDISGATGLGYVSIDGVGSSNTEFYTVNLGTGVLTQVGSFSTVLVDMSVRIAPTGTAAPEPGSLALLAMGAFPLVGLVARRRKNKTA